MLPSGRAAVPLLLFFFSFFHCCSCAFDFFFAVLLVVVFCLRDYFCLSRFMPPAHLLLAPIVPAGMSKLASSFP